MSKRVSIKTSLYVNNNGAEDCIEHLFTGEWRVQNDTHLLSHDEADNKGRSHILLGSDFAEIRRNGLVTSRMRFVEGEGIDAIYDTLHGRIPMTIFTHDMSLQVVPGKGKFSVSYTIKTSVGNMCDNRLEVEWRTIRE